MRYLAFIVISFLIFCLPMRTLAEQMEQGSATLGTRHQTFRSESSSFTSNEYQTDFYFYLSQQTVDFGRIEINIIYPLIGWDFDPKAWSGEFAIWELPVGINTLSDIELGDSSFNFRAIPHFFSNYQLPPGTLRGINSRVWGNSWKFSYFCGPYARRRGTLGDAYFHTDQLLYGFNLGFDLPRESFIGIGYLGSKDEKDQLGNLLVRNNNIILADMRLGITKNLGIMGEYLHSFYNSVSQGKVNDLSLVVGPVMEKEKAHVEANYRRLGRKFRYINASTASITNQEGVFVRGMLNTREEHGVYLYGTGDFYWDEPTPGLGRDRLYTMATNLGATFYPIDNWYFTNNISVIKQNASGNVNPVDDLRYSVQLGASGNIADRSINVYTKLRYSESRVQYPRSNILREPNGRAGIRWTINPRMRFDSEVEVQKRWDTIKSQDNLSGRIRNYFRWSPLSRTILNPSAEYSINRDEINSRITHGLNLSLNYSQQFHKGWYAGTNIIWTKNWGQFGSSYLSAFVNFEKVFRWGKPVLRKGLPKEDQKLFTGEIEGYLFIDENRDGLRQPWEDGIPNIPIRLDGVFITMTDATGWYKFDTVMVGKREIQVEIVALDIKYSLRSHREEADVRLRQTTEVNFPVEQAQ